MLTFLLTLAGCASPVRPINEERPISIRLSAWGSAEETSVLRELLRDFERENPKVRVTLMHIPENYYQKLHLLIAGDLAPDVMMTNSLSFPIYAAHDAFLNLAPRLAADPLLKRTDFYPAALQAFTWRKGGNATLLGALPRDISNVVVFYNRDLFQKAGLPEPKSGWTWRELTETAVRLTQDTNNDKRADVFGFSFYSKPPLFWLPFVWSAGGEVFSPDLSRCRLNESRALEGLQFYADLRNKWHAAPSKAESGDAAMSQLFLQQKLAMMVSGRWSVPILRKQAHFRWDVVPLPIGPSGKSRVGIDGSGYAISAGTSHPDAAWALARFLTSRKAVARVAESGLIVPARRDVAESGLFPRPGAALAETPPPAHGHAFLDVIPDGVPTRTPPRWNEFSEELQLALEPVWDGAQPAKTAVEGALPRLQRLLAGSP